MPSYRALEIVPSERRRQHQPLYGTRTHDATTRRSEVRKDQLMPILWRPDHDHTPTTRTEEVLVRTLLVLGTVLVLGTILGVFQ